MKRSIRPLVMSIIVMGMALTLRSKLAAAIQFMAGAGLFAATIYWMILEARKR